MLLQEGEADSNGVLSLPGSPRQTEPFFSPTVEPSIIAFLTSISVPRGSGGEGRALPLSCLASFPGFYRGLERLAFIGGGWVRGVLNNNVCVVGGSKQVIM